MSNGDFSHQKFSTVITEIKFIQSFVVLAQELHFGRAAKRLHIVQSALSKQMKMLEEEVGCRLFDRNRRGVALSDAGRFFLAEAEQALVHVERAVETARRAGMGLLGRVRLGYSASAVHSGALAQVLARIESGMPAVEVLLERVDPWQQIARLRANDIDLVIGPKPTEETEHGLHIQCQCLAELTISVALRMQHPLAARDALRAEDLEAENFVEFANSEAEGYAVVSRLAGLSPQRIVVTPDPLGVLALVQSGRGVCLLPTALSLPAFPRVVFKPLVGCPALQVAVTRRAETSSALLSNLWKIVVGSHPT